MGSPPNPPRERIFRYSLVGERGLAARRLGRIGWLHANFSTLVVTFAEEKPKAPSFSTDHPLVPSDGLASRSATGTLLAFGNTSEKAVGHEPMRDVALMRGWVP